MENPQNSNPNSPEKRITQSPSDPTAVSASPIGEAAASVVIGNRYNFAWCLKYFDHHGKKMFGEKFSIDEADHELIYRLLVYFLADKTEAERLDIDLDKGIFLSGPIGCGKTSLMTLMRTVPQADRYYRIKSTRDISFEFVSDGYEVIYRYSKLSYTATGPLHYCFDDLGAEQAMKLYGNECNIMAEVLLSRYDQFHLGMITHITTNLSASEVENQYGQRLRSRMREMFNIFAFADEVSDQRR